MKARKISGALALPLVLAMIGLTQMGCALPLLGQIATIHISGKVLGDSIAEQKAGRTIPVAVAATVECNGIKVATSADGTYRLKVVQSAHYDCTAAAPSYASARTSFPDRAGADIALNFGPTAQNACLVRAQPPSVGCSELHPRPGSLSGTVTYRGTHQVASGIQVTCWSPTSGTPANANPLVYYNVGTDRKGQFVLSSLPVDTYLCTAGQDQAAHGSAVAPATSSTLSFAICHTVCQAVIYHSGDVMHTYTAYLIFWLPTIYSYDATGSNLTFESLTERYFQDVGGTRFYNLVTQYWGYQGGFIQNSVTLGGTYLDTTPYNHAATSADPLTDADIQNEITRVMKHQQWKADLGHAFFVFTGYGAEACSSAAKDSCTYYTDKRGYCGYHSYIAGTPPVIYSSIPDVYNCVGPLNYQTSWGPNGDRVADFIIDTVSHEQFETATDPTQGGWYEDSTEGGEIGDKCVTAYGTIRPDGSNVTLGHGDHYLLQEEWSNLAGRCSFG